MKAIGIRRLTSVIMIFALAVCFAAALETAIKEDAHAAVSKKVVKKAKKYTKKANKLFKVGSAWYCFSSKKVKKGLQKVGSKYYFFNKSNGKMVTNKLVTVGKKKCYFYGTSGKAPLAGAVTTGDDRSITFYKANMKRYKYTFSDTGSAAGNIAAGIIISEAGIQPDGTASDDQLKAAYSTIINRSGYKVTGDPKLSSGSNAWLGTYALDTAVNKGGKCYGFAALTGATFRALGAYPTVTTGKCDRLTGKGAGEHAWTEIATSDSIVVYDSIWDVTMSGKDLSFFGKAATVSEDDTFTIAGKDYIYYPGLTYSF